MRDSYTPHDASSVDILTTDDLFKRLPAFVNVDGDLYHFSIIKGADAIIISYSISKSEGGKHLGNTYWRGTDLRAAVLSTLSWLQEYNYIN